MDSLDVAGMIMELEDAFGVAPRDAAALSRDTTLGELWRCARRGAGVPVGDADTPPASDPTWRTLARMAAGWMGKPVDDVYWTDRPFGDPPSDRPGATTEG